MYTASDRKHASNAPFTSFFSSSVTTWQKQCKCWKNNVRETCHSSLYLLLTLKLRSKYLTLHIFTIRSALVTSTSNTPTVTGVNITRHRNNLAGHFHLTTRPFIISHGLFLAACSLLLKVPATEARPKLRFSVPGQTYNHKMFQEKRT